MKNRILAIIPARGGSKRIPKKNIKPFFGREIITYPIDAAVKSSMFERVIVSTDCDDIKNVALMAGAEVPFLRSETNSDDFATTFDVIKEVLSKVEGRYDYVCCIYPTSVFVTPEVLASACRELDNDRSATSIASVLQYSHPIQRSLSINAKYLVSNHPDFYNCRSQDLEANYHDAGQFYIFRTNAVLEEERLITNSCIPYVLCDNHAQDIDTLEDWSIAELKYQLMVSK
ncbi:pseudaminic acid cytidylyltransferase [Vibrio splendidus]